MAERLDHERLDVYQAARELSREVARVGRAVGARRPELLDQLQRATASIVLNIAEASGEQTPRRRAYSFRIARSSAAEAASALDHMVDVGLLAAEDIRAGKALIVRIVSMLVRLAGR